MEQSLCSTGVFEPTDTAVIPIVPYFMLMLQLLEAIYNTAAVKTSHIHGSR